MIELSRTIRFFLGIDSKNAPNFNSFASWPAPQGLSPYYELAITCIGHPDPQTGYFINIKKIDTAARNLAIPYLNKAYQQQPPATIPLGNLLRNILNLLQPSLNQTIASIALKLSPFHTLTIQRNTMHQITISQDYQFSAAHRLHVPQLSDEENIKIFGKCNNPSGHGHNYKLRVRINAPISPQGQILYTHTLDKIVDQNVIEKLDHKHLNLDVPEFKTKNASVEHITQYIYTLLKTDIKKQLDASLHSVSVWETGKTVCTYKG